jgi:hypothetical protein
MIREGDFVKTRIWGSFAEKYAYGKVTAREYSIQTLTFYVVPIDKNDFVEGWFENEHLEKVSEEEVFANEVLEK